MMCYVRGRPQFSEGPPPPLFYHKLIPDEFSISNQKGFLN